MTTSGDHPEAVSNNIKKKRCEFCKKKSLMLFICKCGLNTCIKHKDPETHCCKYDFKQDNVLGIKCEFSKLIKIN